MRVITLEEHFWTPEIAAAVAGERNPKADPGSPLAAELADLGERRLAAMDAAAIDLQVISHTTPGVQNLADAQAAIALARAANDRLAEAVRAHPDRFAGFATLPTQAPEAAADELTRAVEQLGFKGAMVNGHSSGRFLDDPAYDVLLERFAALGVPLYIHPTEPVRAVRDAYYGGLDGAGWFLAAAAWGWHAEAGLHVLRLVLGGCFDRHPGLQVAIGHMGEMLPFMLARIDDNLPPELTKLDRLPSEYILAHVHITTSGLFTLPPLQCALSVFGADRVLFSVDWPYAPNEPGRRLLDSMPVSPADLHKIAHGNAERLLGL
jgi:uncharacterized protein